MKHNVVSWFEIYVSDMDRAREFYHTILGLETEKMDVGEFAGEMYAFPFEMDGTGAAGALVQWKGQEPGRSGTIIYFNTDDCDASLDQVIAAGGTIIQPKTPAGQFGFSALFQDTEGNTIGFYSSN